MGLFGSPKPRQNITSTSNINSVEQQGKKFVSEAARMFRKLQEDEKTNGEKDLITQVIHSILKSKYGDNWMNYSLEEYESLNNLANIVIEKMRTHYGDDWVDYPEQFQSLMNSGIAYLKSKTDRRKGEKESKEINH